LILEVVNYSSVSLKMKPPPFVIYSRIRAAFGEGCPPRQYAAAAFTQIHRPAHESAFLKSTSVPSLFLRTGCLVVFLPANSGFQLLKAARVLGIGRTTLYRRLQEYRGKNHRIAFRWRSGSRSFRSIRQGSIDFAIRGKPILLLRVCDYLGSNV